MPSLRRAFLFSAVLALLGAGAAPVRTPAPLYPGAAPGWNGALGAALRSPALSASLTPGLAALDLTSPASLRIAAPLVANLVKLDYTPAAFAALPAAQRDVAVQLAAEAAREELQQKVYELGEAARAFAHRDNLDREARAELYGVVAHLGELRDHYRAFLDDNELALVEGAYSAAAGKAWSVRQALLQAALTEVRSGGPVARATTLPPPRKPSAAAAALREDMGNTKSGWGQDDLRTLYLGYGFEEREGGKHRFYTHPTFPQLHDSVSRQNDLPPGYAHSALKLLAELDGLSAPRAPPATLTEPHDGPPANLRLEDLAVLLSPPSAKPKPARPQPAPPARRVAVKTSPEAPRALPAAPVLQPFEAAEPEAARPSPPAPATNSYSAWERWMSGIRRLLTNGRERRRDETPHRAAAPRPRR